MVRISLQYLGGKGEHVSTLFTCRISHSESAAKLSQGCVQANLLSVYSAYPLASCVQYFSILVLGAHPVLCSAICPVDAFGT